MPLPVASAGVPVIVPLNTNMDFPLERSLEDCLKAVEVKSLSRYFDDQLDAAEELYGIQLHFNFNTNDVKVLIDSYRIAYSQEICDRCEAGERQRSFSSAETHCVRSCIRVFAASDTIILLHRRATLHWVRHNSAARFVSAL